MRAVPKTAAPGDGVNPSASGWASKKIPNHSPALMTVSRRSHRVAVRLLSTSCMKRTAAPGLVYRGAVNCTFHQRQALGSEAELDLCQLDELRSSKPAPARSTTTSANLRRRPGRPATSRRNGPWSIVIAVSTRQCGSTRDARQAGSMPNATQVAAVTATAKPIARQSRSPVTRFNSCICSGVTARMTSSSPAGHPQAERAAKTAPAPHLRSRRRAAIAPGQRRSLPSRRTRRPGWTRARASGWSR